MGTGNFNLNQYEVKKWAKWSIVHFSPAILAFLMSLDDGKGWEFTAGATYTALIVCLINLVKEFSRDNT